MIKELKGKIAVKFFNDLHLEELCIKYIAGYEVDRFDILAIRVFSGKEFILTIYAADKLTHKRTQGEGLAVKKFKIEKISPLVFLNYIESFNFTISESGFQLDEMEVINR
jgi:hypothetical protein